MSNIEKGVYSETKVQSIGTGGTARTQEITNFYVAEQVTDDSVMVQLMDMNDQLMPIKEQISIAEFTKRFKHHPDYFKKKKSPTDLAVDKAIAQAEAHVSRKEYFSAEFEYGKALKLDEDNVRANFGVAKVYMTTGQSDQAVRQFEKLLTIDAVFEEENKHIFNELGIELRRMGLFDQAIEYYTKALSFTEDDENLYFNVGRAFKEKGNIKQAKKYLQKALRIAPGFVEAKKLLKEIIDI